MDDKFKFEPAHLHIHTDHRIKPHSYAWSNKDILVLFLLLSVIFCLSFTHPPVRYMKNAKPKKFTHFFCTKMADKIEIIYFFLHFYFHFANGSRCSFCVCVYHVAVVFYKPHRKSFPSRETLLSTK